MMMFSSGANVEGALTQYTNVTNDSVTLYEISAYMKVTTLSVPAYYFVVAFFTATGSSEITHYDMAYFDIGVSSFLKEYKAMQIVWCPYLFKGKAEATRT
jgi:hypothetical protein